MSLPDRGVGRYDLAVLDIGVDRTDRITAELARLERAHLQLLIEVLRPMRRRQRVLHLGRSDEVVAALVEDLGCQIEESSWVEDGGWAEGGTVFDAVVDSEVHRRRNLFAYGAQLSRIVGPRGRCAFTTWCVPEDVRPDDPHVQMLNRRTGVVAAPRARYFAALTSNGFAPYLVADLTPQAIPYWRLRQQSVRRTGIEAAFLAAYSSGSVALMLVAAERSHGAPAPSTPAVSAPVSPAPIPRPIPPRLPPAPFGLSYE